MNMRGLREVVRGTVTTREDANYEAVRARRRAASPNGNAMPDTAFSMVGPAFGCTYAIWQDERQDSANFAWLRATSAKIASISLGHYIGEADLDLAERSAGSFAPAAFARLRHLQSKYDPAGLFDRSGSNLEPLRKAG